MQRKGSVPFLCLSVNVPTDTMLNFDANAEVNVNVDTKCERVSTNVTFKQLLFFDDPTLCKKTLHMREIL